MILNAQFLLVSATVISSGAYAQNAFPGALGFGAVATGGNSGTTYHVTNLNDAGTGSFREAVSASNRNIVFDVGGYILLRSVVWLSSDITINGQTAPSSGIGIMGGEVSASNRNNIIIRNLRMRQGTLDPDTRKSVFNMNSASNIILDHCSFAYGQWDTVDAVGAINITVSNSIIAFPIGQQFGAHVETGPSTFYGNLWVSAHNRQALSKGNTQFINNVVYNYQAAYTSGNSVGGFSHDIINNYFIAGPSTARTSDAYYQMNPDQSVYATGNYIDSSKDGRLNGAASNTVGSSTELSAPWAGTSPSMAKLTAAQAVSAVFDNAGASPRDEVDAFAVSTAQSLGKSGMLYTNEASTRLSNRGYGTLNTTAPKS
jgi:pectate lyase